MRSRINDTELGAVLTQVLSENRQYVKSRFDLARKAGIDYGYVHRLFAGKNHPSREYLIKICKTLRCTPEQMTRIFTLAQYTTPTSEEVYAQPLVVSVAA